MVIQKLYLFHQNKIKIKMENILNCFQVLVIKLNIMKIIKKGNKIVDWLLVTLLSSKLVFIKIFKLKIINNWEFNLNEND
jgi:hypothetical protein